MKPVCYHLKIQVPFTRQVKHLKVHNQEESQEKPGDPLQEPSISPT
jgi:hypothetical protein